MFCGASAVCEESEGEDETPNCRKLKIWDDKEDKFQEEQSKLIENFSIKLSENEESGGKIDSSSLLALSALVK